MGVFWIASKKAWRVRWRDAGTGKRVTKHFPEKEKARALAWAQGRRIEERQWGEEAVTQAERVLLARIREAVARGGRTVEELLPELLEVAGRRRLASVAAGEALEKFLTHCQKRNLRAATVVSYAAVCGDFVARSGVTDLARVDAAFVREFIVGRHESEGSRLKAKRHLMAWLGWCGSKGWLVPFGSREVAWPKVKRDAKRIPSLSPGEARGLLAALPEKWRAACALGLFAGVRPEEIHRLRWEEVNLERRVIQIGGEVAKIREHPRTLDDLPGNLWAWIEAHPGERKGRVMPLTMRNWLANLRRAKEAAGVVNWGHDVLRKTFASMAYHLPKGPTAAAEIMGHLNGLKIYLRHYRAVRSPGEAAEYFTIRPPAANDE